jgi:polyhydroxybutyrate depolymerase
VIGISNGGFMAYHLACSGRIELAGIASVIGTMPARDWNNCRPKGSVDLLHIHGALDPLVPYHGGQSWTEPHVTLHPVPEVVRFWASELPNMVALTDDGPFYLDGISDPNRLNITRYASGQSDRRAALITIVGFGHDWPFVEQTGLSTTDAIVGFFLKKPRPDDINARQARLAKPLEPHRVAHQR